jgi:membrane protein
MVPLMALLMILGAVITTFATIILTFPERYLKTSNPSWYAGLVVMLFSLAIGFFVSLALYTIVPVARPNWRQVWKGSLAAGVLFVLLGQLFPIYLRLTGGFSAFGSAFAFALVLLLWFYLLGQIIVVGAEVNALAGQSPAASVPVPQLPEESSAPYDSPQP